MRSQNALAAVENDRPVPISKPKLVVAPSSSKSTPAVPGHRLATMIKRFLCGVDRTHNERTEPLRNSLPHFY
jgi:hypothetical protein